MRYIRRKLSHRHHRQLPLPQHRYQQRDQIVTIEKLHLFHRLKEHFLFCLVIIPCSFEESFCHWERLPFPMNGTKYSFIRKSAASLEENGVPGPPHDPLYSKEKLFAIASNMLPPDSPVEATADLISPYLKGSEHPHNCFSFWFFFGACENSSDFIRAFIIFHFSWRAMVTDYV